MCFISCTAVKLDQDSEFSPDIVYKKKMATTSNTTSYYHIAEVKVC